jgi:acetyltransferase-like isoleucine patch superfamily enzyme
VRVRRTSHAARLRGLARYLVLRATGGRRVHTEGPVYIGPRCHLYAEGEGAALRLGRRVHIAHDVELQARGAELVIGAHTTINPYSRVVAFDGIRIGSHVAIARFVTIVDHDHLPGVPGAGVGDYATAPVTIGDRVWLADKVTVLKGVTIGDDVVVAAHTLVNRDVPSNCVIAGTPFEIVRELEPGRRW